MERTVAIVGSTGQMGAALAAVLPHRPGWEVRPLPHGQIEIAEAESIVRALDPVPDVVINTAVWHGPRQEDPVMALRVNALGPRLLAEFCAQRGACLVHLSTDYVFDGEASEPYRETDRAEPRSVYGISKVAGEQLVRAHLPNHLIVRVASLFGPGGSRAKGGRNFVTTMLDLAHQGKPLRVVADQVHSPTYAPDGAAVVAQLLEAGVAGTVHVSNTGSCSWYEFAAKIFELTGMQPDLAPTSLADQPPDPPRPRYSVLGHYALRAAGLPSPRPWQEALREYLTRLGVGPTSPPGDA
jgi:dTDP-4-dehydrorhamnose reductase